MLDGRGHYRAALIRCRMLLWTAARPAGHRDKSPSYDRCSGTGSAAPAALAAPARASPTSRCTPLGAAACIRALALTGVDGSTVPHLESYPGLAAGGVTLILVLEGLTC
jgi:hypothetical protein